jgi:hypothetical protein
MGLPVGVSENPSTRPIRRLKLNLAAEQDAVEAPIAEADALLVVLTERVHARPSDRSRQKPGFLLYAPALPEI